MADRYCDQSLGTGTNAGTSWANAYQALSTALVGWRLAEGDRLFVKNDASVAAAITIAGRAGWTTNPVRVYGVKSATTNEPPVQSDLIPGWRTGETRTEANLAYNDGELPTLTNTGAGNNITLNGYIQIYGLGLVAQDDLKFAFSESNVLLEECLLNFANGEAGLLTVGTNSGISLLVRAKNCKITGVNASSDISFINSAGGLIVEGGIIDVQSDPMFGSTDVSCTFTGVDFSAQSGALIGLGSGLNAAQNLYVFKNCQLHASTVPVSGTIADAFRVELYGCANVTGKSSGTIQNIDIATDAGNITEETTAVRTGGSDDGSGEWSLAFTPVVDGTRDGFYGLVGPWMAVPITASDTSIDVFIAQSGSTDYQDDEVHLEVIGPSEFGTAQSQNYTSIMPLLETPSNVTDDTDSTWGSGGNNPQMLSVDIAPDFDGVALCRVVFTKNFGASPETLYVDSRPVAS